MKLLSARASPRRRLPRRWRPPLRRWRSAAAETRALEAAARRENGEHFAALRAVARDRLLMRAIRDEGDGAAWWELIGRTHAQAEVKNEDNSGLTMALDAEFLVAGLMGSSSGSGGDAGNAPKTHVQSRLPELLRATAEGQASEALSSAARREGWAGCKRLWPRSAQISWCTTRRPRRSASLS